MNRDGDTPDPVNADNGEHAGNDQESPSVTVEALENRLSALSTQLDSLRDQLEGARDERAELREEVEVLHKENAELRHNLEQLDARTDLLELVKTTDSLDGEQRSVALIQHLKRNAKQKHERGGPAKASVSREDAEAALHFPDIDRTTIYDDMRRAVRLVDDESVLWYDSSSGGNSRLKLDLEAGDLPATVTGQQTNHRGR